MISDSVVLMPLCLIAAIRRHPNFFGFALLVFQAYSISFNRTFLRRFLQAEVDLLTNQDLVSTTIKCQAGMDDE